MGSSGINAVHGQIDHQQASQVLKQNRNKRNLLGSIFGTGAPGTTDATTIGVTTTKSPKEQQNEDTQAFIRENHLNSVEAWEEYKDKLEENTAIPEEEVDELERCCSKCWWKNGFQKIYGRNHHELKELSERNFEETGKALPVPMACPKCIRHIPKHADAPVKGLVANFHRIKNIFRLITGATGRK